MTHMYHSFHKLYHRFLDAHDIEMLNLAATNRKGSRL